MHDWSDQDIDSFELFKWSQNCQFQIAIMDREACQTYALYI